MRVKEKRCTGGSACATFLLPLSLVACMHRQTSAARAAPLPPPQAAVERQIVNAVDAGDGDLEINTLRARLDANPLDLATRLALARRYQKLGFPEVALEHCRLACERAPDSEEAHLALAKMLRDQQKAAEGARMLEDFTKGHQAGEQVWAWLGLLRDDTGDWKAGEAAYRKALGIAPEHDDLHNNLGYCLLRQGKKKEAADEFRAALKLNPHSDIAQNNLAMSLAPASKEAAEHLQAVTDPASAHNNMAVAYIEAGKYAEARREIELALSYNRQHSAALNNLRLVSELDGKPPEIAAPARTEGRRSRMAAMWRRLWGGGEPKNRDTNTSGSPVASR